MCGDEVRTDHDRWRLDLLSQDALRSQPCERSVEVACHLLSALVFLDASQQVSPPVSFAHRSGTVDRTLGYDANREFHVSADTFKRFQHLIPALFKNGRQVLWLLELGAETQRQHWAARHNSLDHVLVREDELARRSRSQ